MFKTSLPDTVTNSMNITAYYATGETGRHVIDAGATGTLYVPTDTAYILVSILSNNATTTPDSIIAHNKVYTRKTLNLLVLGNSFSQDSFAYLPPVLNEMLPDYQITYGVAYEGSAGIEQQITMYNNSTAYTWFNLWQPYANSWVRYTGTKKLTDIIGMAKWDLIYMQGHGLLAEIDEHVITPGHTLIRILNTLIDHNFATATGQWLIENDADISAFETAMEAVRTGLGVNMIIPIGTGISNARSNETFDALGDKGHMRADTIGHQQAGLPALISTYVIASYLCRWLGEANRSVYHSTFVPTTANVQAINAYKTEERPGGQTLSGMTHGDPVGIVDGNNDIVYDNIRAAQEIAVLAVNNPYHVSDCSDILDVWTAE